MSGLLLSVHVPGLPRTQGSMRPVVSRSTGRVVMKKKPGEAEHRTVVAQLARAKWARGEHGYRGPVAVRAHFWLARPKSHYGTGRNAAVLKDAAPRLHVTPPDVDKLCRLVLDALVEGGCIADDAQVVRLSAGKAWAANPQPEGTEITVQAVEL